MKAIGLLGTLKSGQEKSNTEELLEEVFSRLRAHGVETKTVRLIDRQIKHGLTTDMDDEWPGIMEDIIASDIVIFATPIWWGMPSSLVQKVLERMNQVDEEYMTTGTSKLYHKVAGIVVTGHEDGVQHVIGSLSNALMWYGFCLPPESAVYWVGEVGPPMDKDAEKRRANTATKTMIGVAVHNLFHYAKLISDNRRFLNESHENINARNVHCEICNSQDAKDIELPTGWRKRTK